MSNIDDLLKYEQDVIGDTRRLLDRFSRETIEALDTAMGMYTKAARVIGQASDHDADIAERDSCAEQLGANDEEELRRIRSTAPTTPEQSELLVRLEAAEQRLEAKTDRAVILLQMGRAFSRSVVDVLRQRLTPAIGYQRPVVEGLALLFLTRDDPSRAVEWRKILTDEDGREFHGKYQRAMACVIEAAGLTKAYNSASGVSLHLRFAGAVGLDFSSRQELSRRVTETKLLYGELRPGEEFFFMASVVDILQTQARVFARLQYAFPEIREPMWLDQWVPRFTSTVERLRQRLPIAFPEDAARIRTRAMLGIIPTD